MGLLRPAPEPGARLPMATPRRGTALARVSRLTCYQPIPEACARMKK